MNVETVVYDCHSGVYLLSVESGSVGFTSGLDAALIFDSHVHAAERLAELPGYPGLAIYPLEVARQLEESADIRSLVVRYKEKEARRRLDVDKELLYFGCVGSHGHYWFSRHGRASSNHEKLMAQIGIEYKIDGGFCPNPSGNKPPYPQDEGAAQVTHIKGWTILGFWDRSVDPRSNCNSNWVAKGEFAFDDMMSLAKTYFPHIVERFKFEVYLYNIISHI